jgi:hypothetical protein
VDIDPRAGCWCRGRRPLRRAGLGFHGGGDRHANSFLKTGINACSARWRPILNSKSANENRMHVSFLVRNRSECACFGRSIVASKFLGGLAHDDKGNIRWIKARQQMQPHSNFLFLSERRKPLSRFTVCVLIKKYATAAGLGNLAIHPHMLRHACGYSLANRGADTRLIQDYLGHKNITHTVRYTKLAPGRFTGLF